MHHPQIVVFERDGRLAQLLAAVAEANRWPLREARQVESCLRILQQPGPSVFVVKVARAQEAKKDGRSPDRELDLLARVVWELPNIPTVAVGDVEDAVVLAGLAWDVGVSCALFPPLSRDLLPEIVTGLMRAASARTRPIEHLTTTLES